MKQQTEETWVNVKKTKNENQSFWILRSTFCNRLTQLAVFSFMFSIVIWILFTWWWWWLCSSSFLNFDQSPVLCCPEKIIYNSSSQIVQWNSFIYFSFRHLLSFFFILFLVFRYNEQSKHLFTTWYSFKTKTIFRRHIRWRAIWSEHLAGKWNITINLIYISKVMHWNFTKILRIFNVLFHSNQMVFPIPVDNGEDDELDVFMKHLRTLVRSRSGIYKWINLNFNII